MLTDERKNMLLAALKKDGKLIAKDFSRRWRLSEDTIRRDLRELASLGLLQRVHGGALPSSPTETALAERRLRSVDEKRRLGQEAARLVEPGQTVFVDGGTTNLELINALRPELEITVVTHSPTIAHALESHPGVKVIMLGGRLYRRSMVCVGAETALAISRFRFDLCFLGVTAIRKSEGLMTDDFEEAGIKRAFLQQSSEAVSLITMDKLNAASPQKIADVSALSVVVAVRQASLSWLPKQVKLIRAD
jgi:DeoR/GlpR family transcriptional regulator of sugar metabolism